ncbi:MAG: MFS transporter [Caldilineales bacterium]|nr:MFS transporter [Caldilineales bacterium]
MMSTRRLPWTFGLILGLGYFGVTAVSPVYNTYTPLLLRDLGLSAGLVGFVMAWDNVLNMFLPAWAGARSDHTWTRWGRRKPWVLAAAPVAALFFAAIPQMRTLAGLLAVILAANLALSLLRAPGLALLGDLFAPAERAKASGLINLLGGLGVLAALVGSGLLAARDAALPYRLGGLLLVASALVFALLVHERRSWGSSAGVGVGGVWRRLLGMARGQDRAAALVLLAAFFSFSGFNILETWVSSFGRYALGVAPERLPFILAVFAGALLTSALPAGFLGARLGHRPAMAAGMLALALLFAAGLWVQSEAMLMGLLVPAGAAWALIIINLFPLLYQVGGEGSAGLFTGLYYTVTSAAAAAGPQVAGLLLDWSGQDFGWVWALAAGLMAAGALTLARVRE